jgi:hypothetical protein
MVLACSPATSDDDNAEARHIASASSQIDHVNQVLIAFHRPPTGKRWDAAWLGDCIYIPRLEFPKELHQDDQGGCWPQSCLAGVHMLVHSYHLRTNRYLAGASMLHGLQKSAQRASDPSVGAAIPRAEAGNRDGRHGPAQMKGMSKP